MPIEIVGPRPGEKLREELFHVDERPQTTSAERILRAVRETPLDYEHVQDVVERLEGLVATGDESGLAGRVIEIVTGETQSEPVHQPS